MTSATENTVHVVLAVYDPSGSYSQHAGAVMASVFEHTKSPVCVHILHDATLTERNRALLSETAEIFSQNAEFHDVASHIVQLGDDALNLARNSSFSVGTLFRLLIPDILPLDKVIYLDCDVVVNMDIRELWDISLDGRACAGWSEGFSSTRPSLALRMKIMGCDKEYVNAGILLMNLRRMKAKLNSRQIFLWYQRYRHCVRFQDQDVINSCFRGDIKFLESRFNKRVSYGSDTADSILHFTIKPWDAMMNSAAARLYWKAFLQTPWGRLPPEELVAAVLDIAGRSRYMHLKKSQCYGTILRRLGKEFLHNELFMLVYLGLAELYLRTKDFFKSKPRRNSD